MRNGTPVIDAHVHIFPPEIVADRDRYLDRDRWFGDLYRDPAARLVTVDDLLASMDACGVDVALLCGFPWSDPGLCALHNAVMAEAARDYPDRLAWLAIVSPATARLETAIVDAREAGARGVGELNADAQDFEMRAGGRLQAAFATCADLGMPVLIHASEPVGHAYPGKGTAWPQRILALAIDYPELPIVAAHWGGGLPFYELMPEVRESARRIAYDSAATTYLYRPEVFRTVIDLVGSEKVIFASDYPVLGQRRLLDRVDGLPLGSDARSDLLWASAERVYGPLVPKEMTTS